jgi:hypothetical protein
MRDADDVVYWLQERALRRYGATMNAAHTETQEWLWAEEITRLREENARLREALKELIEDHEYMTDTDAEEDNLARAHARAAIREGGKGD